MHPMPLGSTHSETMSRREWIVVVLLFVSVIINYIDRSNLSISAVALERQIGLTPLQMGTLLGAFFWTYALLQIFGIAGWIADRFPVSLVLACGFFIWSGATVATGFQSSFVSLFTAGLFLGLGKSVAFPCYSRIFAELPQQYRGRANALLDAGTKLGPSVGTFVGGMLLIHFGWRILFIALGLGGLVWLGPWFKFMPRPRHEQASKSEPLPPISLLLRTGAAWGTFLGHFCGLYFFYFLLAWLPSFLALEMKLSLLAMTHLTSAIFLVVASSTLTTGWLSDHLIAAGASPTRVRKTIVVCGLSVASSILLLAFLRGNLTASISVLLVACIGYGAYSSNHWAISQTLAGPVMAGRWGSVQNGVGNLAGIAAPWLAGLAVQIRGNSSAAFFIAGVMAIVGAVIWGYMVPRVEQVQWNTSPIHGFWMGYISSSVSVRPSPSGSDDH